MTFGNESIWAVNAGLGFGIFFLTFLTVLVAYVQRKPKRKNIAVSSNRPIRNIAILGILFFLTAIIIGTTLSAYFTEAANESLEVNQEIVRQNVEQQLKDSLITIDLLSAQSEINRAQLDNLKKELEGTLEELYKEKSKPKKRFIPIIPGPNY